MKIFEVLNLEYPGLEIVKKYYTDGKFAEAKIELKKYFSTRNSVKGFITDRSFAKEYIKNNYTEEVKSILEVSNDVINKKFIFTLPWEMERCHNEVVFQNDINWSHIPFEDEEWTFMLNRQRYLYLIAQSYLITEDEKYIDGFEKLLGHWIDNNKLNETLYKTSWRTIESGIRIKNWVKALDLLLETDKLSEDIICKVLVSINEHMEYLKENNKYERILSNWVILEQQGVFMASTYFPELKIAKEFKTENIKTLEDAIQLQVVEDGLHWEQSFQYHNEMLNCYLEILSLASKNNIEINEIIKDKVYSMLKATLYIMKPNKCQSNYGDSDEEDLREILTLGSLIFNDGMLKTFAYDEVDLNSFMLFGESSPQKYKEIKTKSVDKASKAFKDSGLYFMRTGFNKLDSYSMFKCGFLGSGHGHSDMLHLEITYKGEDILVDSGRYTYCGANPLRRELKKPKSHNTTIIDNEDFTVCTSSWGNNGVATPIKGFNKFTDKYDFVEGGHLGYINTRGVFTNRKVVFIKPGIWVTSDEFIGNDYHSYTQFYNFNSSNVKKIAKDTVKYSGIESDFYLRTLDTQGEFSIEDSIISKDYNKNYSSKRAVYNISGHNNTFINTVMYGENKESELINEIRNIYVFDWQNKLVSNEVAEAIEIKLNNKKRYIVLLVHKEDPKGRKLYLVDGYRVYGRVAVIEEDEEKNNLEVLAY